MADQQLTFEDIEFRMSHDPMRQMSIVSGSIRIQAKVVISDYIPPMTKNRNDMVASVIREICYSVMGRVYGKVWADSRIAHTEVMKYIVPPPYSPYRQEISESFNPLFSAGRTLMPKIPDIVLVGLGHGKI